MTTKWASATIEKGSQDRTIQFIASHELVDADGEVVLVDGIDYTTRFNGNALMLEQHQHQKVAVATVTRLWKTTINGMKALMGLAVFPDRPQSDDAWANIQAGLLRGISIGFRSLETGPRMLPGQTGVTHVRSELIEISLVSIPSCPTCLVTSKSAACRCQSTPTPAHSIATRAGELAEENIRRRLGKAAHFTVDDNLTLDIIDEYEIDEKDLAVGVASHVIGWIAAEAADQARRQVNYLRGKVE
jgi:Caudovirus prohead serine protease